MRTRYRRDNPNPPNSGAVRESTTIRVPGRSWTTAVMRPAASRRRCGRHHPSRKEWNETGAQLGPLTSEEQRRSPVAGGAFGAPNTADPGVPLDFPTGFHGSSLGDLRSPRRPSLSDEALAAGRRPPPRAPPERG